MLAQSGLHYKNPELMLFTIIELVGSTCYSCILYQQPVSLAEYRPYLHRTIFRNYGNFFYRIILHVKFCLPTPKHMWTIQHNHYATLINDTFKKIAVKKASLRRFVFFIIYRFPDHQESRDFLYNTVCLLLCRAPFVWKYFYPLYDTESDSLLPVSVPAHRHPLQ